MHRLDLPLAQAVPWRYLPWLSGGLIYLTVVMLGIAVIADRMLLALDERARLMTVTLPLADEGEGGRDVAAALEVLYQNPFVIAAAPVTDAELRTLMAPWLGESRVGDLPLPSMIDVTLDPLAVPDLAALGDALSAAVPGAALAVDAAAPDHAWQIAALVRGWSGLVALLALPAVLVAIAAVTALGLRLCRDAVELLRVMGASPDYLADQFERYALAGCLRGGASGLGLALLTVIALLYSARAMAITGALEIGLRPLDWALLAGMAAAGVLLVVAVVRATAYWRLQQTW